MKNQGFVRETIKIKGGKEGGNAIVIVLIMIALLGALTMTLTRMGGNSNDVSQEQAQVIASQVLRQARTLATATDSLIAKGCSITQLSFENSLVSGYTNVQSPSDKSCWLFDGAGAGLNFPVSPITSNSSSIWHFSYTMFVPGVGAERENPISASGSCPASATACQDMVAFLPFVDINTCKSLNLLTGITQSYSTTPPAALLALPLRWNFGATSMAAQTTNFSLISPGTAGAITNSATPSTDVFWDKKAGCLEAAAGYRDTAGNMQTGTGIYFFYQVLYER